MKLWDTETGKCLNKFTTGKTPHVVRINPSVPHEFLVGMSDKKILQYDTRSGEMVQEYDHHLGPVNTITFCDEVSLPVTFFLGSGLTFARIAALSQHQMTSHSAHGNTESPSPSNSSPSRTCSLWCALRHTHQANTLPSSPLTTKSRCIPRLTGSAKTAKRAIVATTWLGMHQTWPSALMDSSLALVTAAAMSASGIGKLVRCCTRSRHPIPPCWQCSGTRVRRLKSSQGTSMAC